MNFFEAFWGLFGDHFGSILGTFLGHFGGPERTCKKMQENAFRGISPKSLFLKKWKKIGNFGTRKTEENRSQNGTEKGSEKSHLKKWDFHIFLWILLNILYFTGHNGPRGPILLCFTVYSRVRKGRKMTANVAKTLEKQWFLIIFLCHVGKCLEAVLSGPRHPNWGGKVVPKHSKSEGKKGLKTKNLGNSLPHRQTPQKGNLTGQEREAPF